MHPYRVFVSYAHEDRDQAHALVETLRSLGLRPYCDQDIRAGTQFSDAIRALISQAHLFVPLITRNSQLRPWIHQETGYAIALRIPVLTIALENTLPAEMTAQLQALEVKSDLSDLAQQLANAGIPEIVNPPLAGPEEMVSVVDWNEHRSEAIAAHANRLWQMHQASFIRQRGPVTSFSIPDRDLNDEIWRACGDAPCASHYVRHLLREEKRSLERHAREAGCRLIVTAATAIDDRRVGSMKVRLRVLIDFLESIGDKVEVVIADSPIDGSILILGDWLAATSFSPQQSGYRQTTFDFHAPRVLRHLTDFDSQFNAALRQAGIEAAESRTCAMARLTQLAL